MKFFFTSTSILTPKMPSIKLLFFTLLIGGVFVFLGITSVDAKNESNFPLNLIQESYLLNSTLTINDDFKIIKVDTYNESVEGNEDGGVIVFLDDKEVKQDTRPLYKISFEDVSTGKVITMGNLKNPLRITGLVPGEYNNLKVTREFGTIVTIGYNKQIVIKPGFEKSSKNSFYTKNIKPIFDKYKVVHSNLFEHELIPRKYSLINFKDDNLTYYFRDKSIEIGTKDRSKAFLLVFEPSTLKGGERVGEEETKPIENESMRNVLKAENLKVHKYRDIWYKNILDKIDLHLSSNEEGNLTFRYICLPNANTKAIKQKMVAMTHAMSMTIEKTPRTLKTDFIQLENLRAFQIVDGKESEVDVQFSSVNPNGFTIGITGIYDRSKNLIIETVSKQ